MEYEISYKIKKNVLDLTYNKYVQYFNTTLILLVTFLIGVSIAFLTKQIKFDNYNHLITITIITICILSVCVGFLFNFKEKMHNIIEEIKNLKE